MTVYRLVLTAESKTNHLPKTKLVTWISCLRLHHSVEAQPRFHRSSSALNGRKMLMKTSHCLARETLGSFRQRFVVVSSSAIFGNIR